MNKRQDSNAALAAGAAAQGSQLARYLEVIAYKGLGELKAEAKRGYMGILWWVIEPVLYMAVFFLIFGLGLRQGGLNFVLFLLTGLTAWAYYAKSLSNATNVVVANTGLMLQVYLPKILLPIAMLLSTTVKFFILLAVLIVFLLAVGTPVTATWLALPFVIATHMLWTCACAGLVAATVPFIPDLKLLVSNAIMMLFFMSGIFFDIAERSAEAQFILRINPMATILESYRKILLHNEMPDPLGQLVILGVSCTGIWLAVWLFKRFDHLYPKSISL